jgi:hypothetical protein
VNPLARQYDRAVSRALYGDPTSKVVLTCLLIIANFALYLHIAAVIVRLV